MEVTLAARKEKASASLHPGIEEIRQWMEQADPEPEHEQQVTRLALALFDQLGPLHRLDGRARILLQAAALVHDIGMSISASRHHKRSYELIKKHSFSMWRREEVEIIALVARYHRKTEPSAKHEEFVALRERDRPVVCKLAAILRLADGLDRAHLSAIKDIEVEYDRTAVRLKLHAYRDCSTEIWGAQRKVGLFETVFARRVTIAAVEQQ